MSPHGYACDEYIYHPITTVQGAGVDGEISAGYILYASYIVHIIIIVYRGGVTNNDIYVNYVIFNY